jgi:glucose-6-phosphate 1-dehydrogenase
MAHLDRELPTLEEAPKAAPRQAGPCVMIIFGASGDLTARKLMPALYNMVKSNLLSREFAIVGIGRNDYSTDQFRQIIGQKLQSFATTKVDGDLQEWLLKRIYYVAGEFNDDALYTRLGQKLDEVDKNHNTHGNYFFYLATSPVFFGVITDHLGASGLACEKDGHWRRIVFEKPFGNDLESARALNRQVRKVLTENQIYRIDHYLGKETVQNILVFRFGNGIFEPIWNRRYVDHVQITVAETVGVEQRGGYFDMAGTLRDMVPNHLFQLLSLTTMEPPISFSPDAVHDEQSKILHAIQPLDAEAVLHYAVRGQYDEGEVKGEDLSAYRAEQGVPPDSRTETFVALKLLIDNWRWADVPFYIRTGKRMARRVTEVAINFRRAPHLLFRGQELDTNTLVLNIQPEEGISVGFHVKVPGQKLRLSSVSMDFSYLAAFGASERSAYATLLNDCMRGDATLFDRADGVEAAWAFVQPILDAWENKGRTVYPYPAGSWGPREADELLSRDGRHWRKP